MRKWVRLIIFTFLLLSGMNLLLVSKLIASETGKIKKHIAVYGNTIGQQKAEFIASHFDIVDTGFLNAPVIGEIKLLNPNIIVVGYRDAIAMHDNDKYGYDDWPEVNSREDWFVHDQFGHRLRDDTWNWYLMDPGKEGWRNHYANYVKNKLDNNPMFDGVFADDVQKSLSFTRWHIDLKNELSIVKDDGVLVDVAYPIWVNSNNKISVYTNPESTGTNYYTGGSFISKTITLGIPLLAGTPVYVNYSTKDINKFRPADEKVNSWHSDMISLLKTAKSVIEDKLLILNGGYRSDYLDSSDGTMVEGFVHASWYSEGYFAPFYQWKEHIDYLDSIAGTEKMLLAQSGINKNIGSEEEDARMMLYCFGSYLLGAGENTSFNFENRGFATTTYYYSDLWDISLGKPINHYYLLSEGYSGYGEDVYENLVNNPSYEQGMIGWGVRNWQGAVNLEIDSSIFKDGNKSVKISADSGSNTGGSSQDVNLEPHTTYTLNGWVNAENLQSSAYTAALLVIYGGKDIASGKQYSVSDGLRPGIEDWRYISVSMTTPDNTSGAYIFAGQIVNAKGTAWFDDIKLVRGTEYKVFARDFEKGKVLVNPMYGSVEVKLDGRYKTIKGDIVTEVVVDGHQTVILIKDKNTVKGDVNGDGLVNTQDLQAAINHILRERDWGSRADVNEDGGVDILDVQEMVNIIMGI